MTKKQTTTTKAAGTRTTKRRKTIQKEYGYVNLQKEVQHYFLMNDNVIKTYTKIYGISRRKRTKGMLLYTRRIKKNMKLQQK